MAQFGFGRLLIVFPVLVLFDRVLACYNQYFRVLVKLFFLLSSNKTTLWIRIREFRPFFVRMLVRFVLSGSFRPTSRRLVVLRIFVRLDCALNVVWPIVSDIFLSFWCVSVRHDCVLRRVAHNGALRPIVISLAAL